MPYRLIKQEGAARRGEFTTVHGTVQTPAFQNVATAAAIKTYGLAVMAAATAFKDLTNPICAVCNSFVLAVAVACALDST